MILNISSTAAHLMMRTKRYCGFIIFKKRTSGTSEIYWDIQSGRSSPVIVADILDTMMEIYDEYDGAKKYINEAIRLKPTDKARADKLVTMSAQEKGHGDDLSATVGKMLEKAKAEQHPCYAVLAMVWHYIKARQDGYAAWILAMHEQYKK